MGRGGREFRRWEEEAAYSEVRKRRLRIQKVGRGGHVFRMWEVEAAYSVEEKGDHIFTE